ncbi:MAG: hypothetical protein M0R17_00805 [Candidatus Omnitrophica bacterium]|jgi:hypothetical protein|nr:hypothetical protein [Candidatus Omnitrophota bacterium]
MDTTTRTPEEIQKEIDRLLAEKVNAERIKNDPRISDLKDEINRLETEVVNRQNEADQREKQIIEIMNTYPHLFKNPEFKFEGVDTTCNLPELATGFLHHNYSKIVENRIAKLKEDLGYLVRGEYKPMVMTFKFAYGHDTETVRITSELEEKVAKILSCINESMGYRRRLVANIAFKGILQDWECDQSSFQHMIYVAINDLEDHEIICPEFLKNVKTWAESQNTLNEEMKELIASI